MKPSKTDLYLTAAELVKIIERKVDEEMTVKLSEIVKVHAKIAVGSVFIPIPGADLMAAATNIWTMYVRINKEIGLPFRENAIKSIASGVVTNLGAAIAGSLAFGTALKLFPGIGTVSGSALLAATVYGVTITAGIYYMKALSKLYDLEHGHNSAKLRKEEADEESELREILDGMMKDKESVKRIINSSKKDYKSDKS